MVDISILWEGGQYIMVQYIDPPLQKIFKNSIL